ncbi:hypothetical protein ACP3T3_01285 [Chryseobacterium sp. CBSDS_008]|uniref:hypothetical protein n=1 Tax=Chryseobacterium sp. CBSDS_008 TaxID=3415265 RepID=UPI003CFA3DF1
MSKWSEILLSNDKSKAYNDFLTWILENDYFKTYDNLTVAQISRLSGYSSAKVSKWLQEIYEEFLTLMSIILHYFTQSREFQCFGICFDCLKIDRRFHRQ